jgi:hypothetical protein
MPAHLRSRGPLSILIPFPGIVQGLSTCVGAA